MDTKIVALAVVAVLCCSLVIFFMVRPIMAGPKASNTVAPLSLPPQPLPQPQQVVAETTQPPMLTTAPPQNDMIRPDVMLYAPGNPWWVYPPGSWGPRYPVAPTPPYPRQWWPTKPRPIQPGGSWPELMGRDKDDAVAYVMSTYPNMHVALVRYGAIMPADYRADRFTIVYDAWTRKVVGAQIG